MLESSTEMAKKRRLVRKRCVNDDAIRQTEEEWLREMTIIGLPTTYMNIVADPANPYPKPRRIVGQTFRWKGQTHLVTAVEEVANVAGGTPGLVVQHFTTTIVNDDETCKHCGQERRTHGRITARCPNPDGLTWRTFDPGACQENARDADATSQ